VPAGWVANLAAVEILDGQEWAARSDHSPLKVDVQFRIGAAMC
jgi:endonuclease/exonuclease/phosphatase family metal-dependent hydrolase